MKTPLTLGLIAIVCAPCTYAQEGEEPAEIEPVVITATRLEQPASAIPGTVIVLDRAAIDAQAQISDDLASVLEQTIPSFGPSLRKLTGRAESLRGRNPLYLIDGVPQHNALRDGSRDGHTIDLDFIERIEVINGSNAIQGVGATGGVVQMVTRSPRSNERWETTLNARVTAPDNGDSDGLSYKVSALTGRRIGDFDLVAGIALHERGLFFDGNGDEVGLYPTQGDIMDSTSLGLFFKGAWRISDESDLTFMINDFDLERNGDFRVVLGDRSTGRFTSTEAGDPSALVGDPARNDVTTASLTYRHRSLLGGSLTAQLFDQSYEARFEGGTFGGFFRLTPDGAPFLDQSAVVSDKNGLRLTWNRPVGAQGSSVALGLDYFRDDSAQVLTRSGREWVPETRFETLAPFVQGTWAAGDAVTVVAGLRHEDAELKVDDFTTIAAANSTFVRGGAPDFSETLPNAGVIWRFAEYWNVYGSFSEGFTMPDAGRVLRGINVPGLDVDSLLTVEPIVTDNREIGLEFDNGAWRASIAAYDSEADNGSRLLLNDAGIFEVQRLRTEIDGIEVAVDVPIGGAWYAGGNYANLDGRFDSDGDGRVDSDLDGINIAPNRLNLYAEGPIGDAINLRIQASVLDDRDFSGPGAPVNRDFDGFTIFDAFATWETRYGRFGLAIENLFDKEYETYFSQVETGARADTFFAGVGRTLSLSWRTSF
ncbi:MAG: TonB-dependent receptor [Pseudomonadota bacterium]